MSKSRVEALSDGVFAVAITLLVFALQVPRVDEATLGTALLRMWPAYASYSVSFVTIGIIWVNHHHLFTLIHRVNRWMIFLNLLILMLVAFLPFPTALLGGYILTGDGSHVAAAIYGATMTALAVSFSLLWTYVVRHQALLGAHLDPADARASVPRFTFGLAVYLLATLISLLSAVLSLGLYAIVAVYYAFSQLPEGNLAGDDRPAGLSPSDHGLGMADARETPRDVASEFGGAEPPSQG